MNYEFERTRELVLMNYKWKKDLKEELDKELAFIDTVMRFRLNRREESERQAKKMKLTA